MTASDHLVTGDRPQSMWYVRNSPNPVRYKSGGRPYANHHLLPIASVGRTIGTATKKDANLLMAIEYFTEWNINAEGNMIILPTRKAYQMLFGKRGGRQIPGLSEGKACHSWAHIAYNDAVIEDLIEIWNKVKIKVEKHEWSANSVAGTLVRKQTKWRGKVTGRKATIENWRAMCGGDSEAHNHFTMVEVDDSPF
jgi:hypothetical protein